MRGSDLLQIAFTALLFASKLPIESVENNSESEGGLGEQSNITPGGCGAYSTPFYESDSRVYEGYNTYSTNRAFHTTKADPFIGEEQPKKQKEVVSQSQPESGYYPGGNGEFYPYGLSSYPGTSTGPGVDNGYNATPSGNYPVNVIGKFNIHEHDKDER